MSLQPLIPFEHQSWLEAIRLQAEAMRDGNQLRVCFRLEDPDASVRMPAATAAPERRDELWQSTCFEVFFAVAGSPCYWELNLSPNGHWNAYRLEGYRQGLQPEPSISTLAYSLKRCSSSLELTLQLPLEGLVESNAELEVSVTAVLDQARHGCSYWAWKHIGTEPDFHQRPSFGLIPKRN